MIELTRVDDIRSTRVALLQDAIRWRQIMEGMISKEWIKLQREHYTIFGGKYTPEKWAQQLVIKLLEVTHGQRLYRNIQVHDSSTGLLATQRKEKLQQLTEDQLEISGSSLEEEDKFLLEINLEDLETMSRETQEYWLLAILAAREARILREESTAAVSDHNE